MTQLDFGNPLFEGGTAYALCIYDDDDRLAGELIVDRAGDACGSRPCWKTTGMNPPLGRGYQYRDREGEADGTQMVKLQGSAVERSFVLLKAANDSGAGQNAMPTGVTSRLQGASSAIVQMRIGADGCLSAYLLDVTRAEEGYFRAK